MNTSLMYWEHVSAKNKAKIAQIASARKQTCVLIVCQQQHSQVFEHCSNSRIKASVGTKSVPTLDMSVQTFERNPCFEAKSAEGQARVGHRVYDGVFFLEFVEYINFTVSRSGAPLLRSPTQTLSLILASFLLAPLIPRIVPACCAQEASSTSILSIPHGRLCLWQVQVRPAPRSVWLGPRPATPLRVVDKAFPTM